MKAVTNINGEFCKKLLKLIPVLALMGMCIPSAQAIFETGYTFEPPDTTATISDVLTLSYDGRDFSPHYGNGYGPNLTAAAAKHGNQGLDFTSFNVPAGYEPYTGLQTMSSTISFQNGFTLGMWLNLQGVASGGSGYTRLFNSGDFYNAGSTTVYIQPDGKFFFSNAYAFNAFNSLTSVSTVQTGVWTHLALTWDDTSDTVNMYINGVLDASLGGITSLYGANSVGTTPTVLRFGFDGGYYNRLTGYMDDVYFADYAKTSSQVLDLMTAIPEPSSVTLAGLGGLVLLRRLRKSTSRS